MHSLKITNEEQATRKPTCYQMTLESEIHWISNNRSLKQT